MPRARLDRASIFLGTSWTGLSGLLLLGAGQSSAASPLIGGLRGAVPQQDIPARIIPILAIAGFCIGLFVKRLLGDR